MNILFDARYITQNYSGVGYYAYNLLLAFNKYNRDDFFHYLTNKENEHYIKDILPDNCKPWHSKISFTSHPLFEIHSNFFLPREMLGKNIDVFHGPAIFIPLMKNKKYKLVATIHDLVAFLHPETVPKKYIYYLKWMTRMVLKKADRIVAASENTKKDLMEMFDFPENKVAVTHYAPSEKFSKACSTDELIAIKKKFNIPERFILFVGNIEPRKNLKRLIQAFAILKDKGIKNCKLVLVGVNGWLYSEIFAEAEKIKQDVVFTGYVSINELINLYQSADVFVFPSLYEGFGLPLLEAMASGTPIAASNSSSIPEIVGDAALLFDPERVEKIVDALYALLENKKLRETLKERQKERIKLFSWEETARKTMNVYKS